MRSDLFGSFRIEEAVIKEFERPLRGAESGGKSLHGIHGR
jgi:hypothetical protein